MWDYSYKSMSMFEYEPMFEYRLIYRWDAEHWTCISTGTSPVDISAYINKNLEDMRDAAAQTLEEEGIAECYAIEYYSGSTLLDKWEGTLEDLSNYIKEISDSWLSLAFQ